MTTIKREPALVAGLVNSVIYVLGAFVIHMTPEQEALLIAATAAVLGVVVAYATHDGLSAAILGFVKSLIAVALGFGLHLDADHQAILLSFAAAITAMFVRTQAVAPLPASALPTAPPN